MTAHTVPPAACAFCNAVHVVGICCCDALGVDARPLHKGGACPGCRSAQPMACCGGVDGHEPSCLELEAARAYADQLAMKRRMMKRRYLR